MSEDGLGARIDDLERRVGQHDDMIAKSSDTQLEIAKLLARLDERMKHAEQTDETQGEEIKYNRRLVLGAPIVAVVAVVIGQLVGHSIS